MTICPCCGFKFEGNLSDGCEACGARSVGEALPRPEHELPSYARSLLLAVTGSLMGLVFLSQTIVALLRRPPVSLSFLSWIAAAETAAWRLKWIAIPATIVVLWGTRKLYRSMLQTPTRFCALGYARGGLIASTLVPVLIAVLIGVTVPERLRRRQLGIEAGINAGIYRVDRALLEYAARFNTLPSENYLQDLKLLPDPDGSLAAALRDLGPGVYKTSGPDVAVLPKQKQRTLRGAVIRSASVDVAPDDPPLVGLSFTNYELKLPGVDKILGTEDDLIVRDGLITRAAEAVPRTVVTTAATNSRKP
ncbi:MAG: hypothetical protein ACR2G5_14565 [Pyrinomonadaceae bacterium]